MGTGRHGEGGESLATGLGSDQMAWGQRPQCPLQKHLGPLSPHVTGTGHLSLWCCPLWPQKHVLTVTNQKAQPRGVQRDF